MKQLTSYELKEAKMSLERGGVVIDASDLVRFLSGASRMKNLEADVAELRGVVNRHDTALKKARKAISNLSS